MNEWCNSKFEIHNLKFGPRVLLLKGVLLSVKRDELHSVQPKLFSWRQTRQRWSKSENWMASTKICLLPRPSSTIPSITSWKAAHLSAVFYSHGRNTPSSIIPKHSAIVYHLPKIYLFCLKFIAVVFILGCKERTQTNEAAEGGSTLLPFHFTLIIYLIDSNKATTTREKKHTHTKNKINNNNMKTARNKHTQNTYCPIPCRYGMVIPLASGSPAGLVFVFFWGEGARCGCRGCGLGQTVHTLGVRIHSHELILCAFDTVY